MVKLRLHRMGKKKAPFYRIVAIDSRKSRDGEYIECVGYYEPTKQPANVKLESDKIISWLEKGAQPTETVKSLIKAEIETHEKNLAATKAKKA